MGVIEVKNLTKDYGYNRGVFDISFCVNKGEVFGFLGPNGAGKSTAIRHIMGFSKPDHGETKIFDKESFNNYYKILDGVGYLPGEIALPSGLTGYEFINMMKELKKIKDDTFINYLIKLFQLDPSGDTKSMSLGNKRKLAIVTAFMNNPDVLILDEPTSGLDPVMQDIFIKFIIDEKKKGKTILLSSHIFSEVDATCDRIAIIKNGKIVSEFVSNDLKHKTSKIYEIKFETDKDLDKFIKNLANKNAISIMNINKDDNTTTVNVDDLNINCLVEYLKNCKFIDFIQHKETLGDYFMKYYKDDKDFGGVK